MRNKRAIKWVRTVVSLVVAALALSVGTASAQTPPGKGLADTFTAMCGGQPVTFVTSLGRTGWADGEHAVLQSVTVNGPDGTMTREFGNKTGLRTTSRATNPSARSRTPTSRRSFLRATSSWLRPLPAGAITPARDRAELHGWS